MDFNYTRRNSLFSRPVQPGINPKALSITPDMMNQGGQDQIPQQPPNSSTLTDAYREMINAPSGPANQRYKDFLDEGSPSRDDYKPTKMNRLAAILAGASDGIQRGGGEGYNTARKVLDQPYDNAMGDYKLRASKLEAGANLEDKETNNKVKTYRDFITDQNNDQRNQIELKRLDETSRVNNGRLENWKSEAASRETPEQRMNRALGVQKAATAGRVESGKALFDYEQPTRTRDAIKVAGVRGDITARNQDKKFESIKDLRQYVADNVTKDKYTFKTDKNGMIVGVNNSDPNDTITTTINSGKLNDTDKAALNLKNSQTLKATPGAATKKTTTSQSTSSFMGGTKRTTESVTAPVENKSTEKVSVIGPNGEVGKMDAAEFVEAQKHGWKKK